MLIYHSMYVLIQLKYGIMIITYHHIISMLFLLIQSRNLDYLLDS